VGIVYLLESSAMIIRQSAIGRSLPVIIDKNLLETVGSMKHLKFNGLGILLGGES